MRAIGSVMLAGPAALAVLATGCVVSPVEADATVRISGRVQHDDGAPAPDAVVVFDRVPGVGELLSNAAVVLSTAGLVCWPAARDELEMPGDMPPLCRDHARSTVPGPDGAFALQLQGRDAGISTSFVPLPAAVAADAIYEVRFEDARGQLVWSHAAAPGSSVVDPRVLEDLAVGVSVTARTGQGADPRLGTAYRSAQVPVVAGAGAPPSRGVACAAGRTGHASVLFAPCPLTDGDLATPFVPIVGPRCSGGMELPEPPAPPAPRAPGQPPPAPPAPPAPRAPSATGAECEDDTWVTLDLGESQPRELLVVRGSHNRFTVEVSVDGAEWHAVTTVSHDAGLVQVPLEGRPARHVRLRPLSGPAVHFHEVSVW